MQFQGPLCHYPAQDSAGLALSDKFGPDRRELALQAGVLCGELLHRYRVQFCAARRGVMPHDRAGRRDRVPCCTSAAPTGTRAITSGAREFGISEGPSVGTWGLCWAGLRAWVQGLPGWGGCAPPFWVRGRRMASTSRCSGLSAGWHSSSGVR